MFRLVFMEPSSGQAFKKVLYTIDNGFVGQEISYHIFKNILQIKSNVIQIYKY
jgi:hypothetical protein